MRRQTETYNVDKVNDLKKSLFRVVKVSVNAGRGFSRTVGTERREEGSAHPFAALPSVCQHLLQGADRQRLLQHKVADAQVRRDILQGGQGGKEG